MAGELRIGGSTASVNLQGNDTIAADQTFTFPDSGAEIVVTPGTADIETSGAITANSTLDAGRLQVTRQSGTYQVFQVRNGGPSATKTAWIQADGNASFVSTRSANVFINLDPDNPQNYVSTANKETGETEQVYSGPTLDVRQVLLDLQSKVEALQAEIQTLKGGAS